MVQEWDGRQTTVEGESHCHVLGHSVIFSIYSIITANTYGEYKVEHGIRPVPQVDYKLVFPTSWISTPEYTMSGSLSFS